MSCVSEIWSAGMAVIFCRHSTDCARGSDQEFDGACAALLGKAVAQNELIGPGDDIAGLIVPGRIHHEEVHAESAGGEGLVHELQAGFANGAVLDIVNARRGASVLRVNAQADVAVIIWLGLGNNLDGGFFLLRLPGDVAIAKVFPEAAVAGNGLEHVEALGREPRHASLFSVAVSDVGPAGFVLVLGPEEVENSSVEVLFVGLLLLFQVGALRMALGDAAIGFVRGVELAGGCFDAPHGGLVASEDTEIVLLAKTLAELLDLLGRDFGIGTEALPSQRSWAMTSRMPEISVSLSRTSCMPRSKCCGPMRKTSLAGRSQTERRRRETSSIKPRVCLNCSFSLKRAMTFFRRGWNG